MTPIAIPPEVLAAVYGHALAAFPDECCGYLVGVTPGAVDAAVACRNAVADAGAAITPELASRRADTGFVIAGDELFRFARAFDGDRPPRIVYHSHTNGRAYFSAIDRKMAAGPAYPVQHLVVGIVDRDRDRAPSVTQVAQFAWSDTERDYVEIARWATDGARS